MDNWWSPASTWSAVMKEKSCHNVAWEEVQTQEALRTFAWSKVVEWGSPETQDGKMETEMAGDVSNNS